MMPIKSLSYLKEGLEYKSVKDLKVQNLEALGEIQIILVAAAKDPNYAIWKGMMVKDHYLHSSKLFGQQLKYLIKSSEYGWIGGLGFGSAAWKLKPRDDRIGWDTDRRKKELNKVICNSRFLILPEYGVKNLASYAMSLCLKRVGDDCENIYHVRPNLVESFVDSEKFSGTCYKASNWILVGQTKGRGRNDRYHRNNLSKKHIFMYEFEKGVLCPVREDNDDWDWVDEEFRYAELPNEAKKKRLISLTSDFFAKPASPIPLCCEGEAKLKGAYRFFGDNKIKPEDILNSHVKQSIERAKEHKVVLSVNDTTSINLSTHNGTKGLGCLSSSAKEIGYLLHDTVLFTTGGVPLGVLQAQTWARDVKEHGRKKSRRNKPIEEKESYKWLKSLKATAEAQEKASEVEFVSVGDREADIYELFELGEELGVSLLVRSSQNRKNGEGINIWDLIEKESSSGRIKVSVRGKNRKLREAELEIRFCKATLPIPRYKKRKGEITLWAISAKEISPPPDEKALHWKLFTNKEVGNFDQACEKVEWYSTRFRIETFHRILKSGRRSEDKRLNTLDRLERCLAIDIITAWRIMYLTMQGRETPEINSDLFFNKNEIEVLKRLRYGKDYNSKQGLLLKVAIMIIATLGGFVKGKNRVPGVEVMWRGLRRLEDITIGVSLMKGLLSEKDLKVYYFDDG